MRRDAAGVITISMFFVSCLLIFLLENKGKLEELPACTINNSPTGSAHPAVDTSVSVKLATSMTVLFGLLLLSGISAALTASRHIITSAQPPVRDPNREEVNAPPRYAQPGTDNCHPVVEGSAQVPGKLINYASAAGGRNLNHDYPGLPEAGKSFDLIGVKSVSLCTEF
ncbi:unnamed protein product [Dibothriocephalus latus]|uniref:Uncharacterized protein n=1 Tax=Dibothriocephalus latus TaxID=60516 RepID=A0A3P6QRH7_DIBLA|nr:unnamed protein product [Dibothriocephalus latus]